MSESTNREAGNRHHGHAADRNIRVACIDIGTVTCRLAVATMSFGHVLHMDKTSTICDLGEGLSATGRIGEAARTRVVACITSYMQRIATTKIDGVCCTLTSAARDASNSSELLGDLAALGLTPEVIPGSVEGALTFLGVASDFVDTDLIVADNGGGSTELAAGRLSSGGMVRSDGTPTPDATVRHDALSAGGALGAGDALSASGALGAGGALDLAFVESVDVGCRRITERFLSADGLDSAEEIAAARAFAHTMLAPAAARAQDAVPTARTLVTCGGTVTTLVAFRDKLVPYDPERVHRATLTRDDIDTLSAQLAALSLAQRATLPGLQAKRAPVILGGAIIVSELLGILALNELVVSEHDLLYGLALSAAAALTHTTAPCSWVPRLSPPPL